jgi:hypothetical protein
VRRDALFFSVSLAKRTVYILTMYPALALLVGAGLDCLAVNWPRRRWLVWPLAGLALRSAPRRRSRSSRRARAEIALARPRPAATARGAPRPLDAGAAGAGALRPPRRDPRRRSRRSPWAWRSPPAATVMWVLPRFDAVKSARPLSAELLRRIAPGEPYAIYPRLDASYLFYTHLFCELPQGEAELRAFAARPGRVWLLIKKRELAKLAPPLPLVEAARDADVREGYALLTHP